MFSTTSNQVKNNRLNELSLQLETNRTIDQRPITHATAFSQTPFIFRLNFCQIQTLKGALLTNHLLCKWFINLVLYFALRVGHLKLVEKMINSHYSRRDADSCGPKLKFWREIVIIQLLQTYLKVNCSVKMLWRRLSVGVACSGLWALVQTDETSQLCGRTWQTAFYLTSIVKTSLNNIRATFSCTV